MRKIFESAQRQLTEGYTHYWRSKGFDDKAWAKLVAEAKKIVAAAKRDGIAIAGLNGDGKPEFSDEAIALNGAGDDAYESFVLTKAPQDFKFTKTEHRPYDAVVVSILAAAKKLGKGFSPSSDGGAEAITRVY